MEPIEIDVVLQLPIPVAIRWPDQDATGRIVAGGTDTVVLPSDVSTSLAGRSISVWMRDVEFIRKIVGYDTETRTVRVDNPWSPTLPDGTSLIPSVGSIFAIEISEVIELPRLGVDGLIPWLDDITRERREALRAGIKQAGITGRELAASFASVEMNAPAVITDLNVPIRTPAGVRRVLALSLAKTNLPQDKQSRVLEALIGSGHEAVNLASRISTLFYTGERREAPKVDALAEAKAAFPGIKIADKVEEGKQSPLAIGPGSGQEFPMTG